MPRHAIEEFEQKYIPEPNSGCWLWIGALKGGGPYGAIRQARREVAAHRFSWMFSRGPIVDGLCVLHKCDTPLCVNPDHLFLGTRGDNNRDRSAKGRSNGPRGERAPKSKLSVAQVMEIRADNRRPRFIARDYGVSRQTIFKIRKLATWTHLNA